jgi:hypothetical protein
MPSTAEALKLLKDPEIPDSRLALVPSPDKSPANSFGHTPSLGSERIRAGLRTRPTEIFGKPLKEYSDLELRAAIKRAQRKFQKP